MVATKGIIHAPSAKMALTGENRDALLTAIARARLWIEDMRHGRIASFADIASREHRDERYIRSLASLAFVSPRIVTAIVDGSAPPSLTVSGLFKALPYSWAEQERRIGLIG
jgi:site-specific DNA recombinase